MASDIPSERRLIVSSGGVPDIRGYPKPGFLFVGGKTAYANASGGPAISLRGLTGGIADEPAAGDIVIVATGYPSTADGDAGVTTIGYTELAEFYTTDTRDCNFAGAYKIMGGTPDTEFSVVQGSRGHVTCVHVWRGIHPITPMDVTRTTASGFNGGLPDAPPITPVTAGAIVIAMGMGSTPGPLESYSTPGGMTNGFSVGNQSSTFHGICGIASYPWDSGAYDPPAWTGGSSDGSDSWGAITIALRPVASEFR